MNLMLRPDEINEQKSKLRKYSFLILFLLLLNSHNEVFFVASFTPKEKVSTCIYAKCHYPSQNSNISTGMRCIL